MIPAKQKAPMAENPVCNEETPAPSPPQASLPQQFSAFAAKHALQNSIELDDDYFGSNERDESNTGTSDNDSDSCDNDNEVDTWLT